jgi:hypothetical protein
VHPNGDAVEVVREISRYLPNDHLENMANYLVSME